jgi:REP element-mobilizing transposase RayT
MTVPRQILPGACYLVTRRCAQRQFLLRPSKTTNDVFLFLLAVAARRFRVRVHAFCVMSNHIHLVVTDTEARLPAFHQFLDALVARAVNASLGRWEAFWAPNSYSAVKLVAPNDIVDKTAYVLANPVSAGLVRSGRLWPGLWSDPDQIGRAVTEIHRPRHFFREKGALPQKVALELTTPPGFDSPADFRDRVTAALDERQREAERRVGKRGFLGVARVLQQKPMARPASMEPRRDLNPRVAARNTWKRIEALARAAEFVRSYRSALAARRAGNIGVVFPAGTYLLRVAHGVPCEAFG